MSFLEEDYTTNLEEILKLIDQSVEILDRIEAAIGSIATHIDSNEVPSAGSIYQLYSLVVMLRDNLVRIRNTFTRGSN